MNTVTLCCGMVYLCVLTIHRFSLICELPFQCLLILLRDVYLNLQYIVIRTRCIVPTYDMILCSNWKPRLSKVHINIEMGNLHMRLNRSIFLFQKKCQVRDLLSEQVTSVKQEELTVEQEPSSRSSNVPTTEVVVKATLRQLEKIKHSGQGETQQSRTRFVYYTQPIVLHTFRYHQRAALQRRLITLHHM